jgi:alginate O-acetyltransferase complex protein AlgI
MLLCGLWHGAGITFIIWGGLHGLFLSFERLFVYGSKSIPTRPRIRSPRGLLRFIIGWISTQALVTFAWLFFRASDLGQVGYFIRQTIHWQGSDLTGRFVVIVLSFGLMVLALDLVEYFTRSELYLLKLRPAMTAAICVAVLVVVGLFLATNKPLPFVYFQF